MMMMSPTEILVTGDNGMREAFFEANPTASVSPTEIPRRSDNGTEERFFKANPVACGVAPQTWAAEVTLMQRFAIGF